MWRRLAIALGIVLLAGATGGVVAHTRGGSPVLGSVTVGRNPGAIVVDEATGRAFIANTDSASVSVLDTRTGALLRTVRVGSYPRPMVVDARTRRVFVANSGSDSTTVSVLDAGSGALVQTVQVGVPPTALALDSRGDRVFVATLFGAGVRVLDGRSGRVEGTIFANDESLYAVALAGRDGRILATTADQLSVLDARSGRLLRSMPVGDTPLALAADAQSGHAFVSGHIPNSTGDVLAMLDAGSGRLLHTVSVGRDPFQMRADGPGGRLFVANQADGTVSVLSTHTGAVLRTVPVGTNPVDLAVDSRTGRVFVANRDSDSISVLDARRGTLLRTLALGVHPQAVAVDERNGRVVIATAGGAATTSAAWLPVPQPLRHWLPFLAARRTQAPPRAMVLDESRL